MIVAMQEQIDDARALLEVYSKLAESSTQNVAMFEQILTDLIAARSALPDLRGNN